MTASELVGWTAPRLPVSPTLLWTLRGLAMALGTAQAWVGRHSMNTDGISYLDIAELYARGDWQAALNAYWSPLYSWLLAAVFAIAPPPAELEFQVVHLVNLAIFVGNLLCFEWLMAELIRSRLGENWSSDRDSGPARWWVIAGYALFLWASLYLITLTMVTPDLLAAGLIFAVGALLMRASRGKGDRVTLAALGATLGLAYLAKTFMVGLALVTFAILPWVLHRRRVRSTLLVAGMFAVFALPFMVAISSAKGRPTIGDAGRLNFQWLVAGQQPPYRHWQGGADGFGIAVHPTRMVNEKPAVFEFATPIAGTYPPWLDPSYWYEGSRQVVRLGDVGRALFRNAFPYWDMLALPMVIVVVLIALRGPPDRSVVTRDFAKSWPLLALSCAGLAAYAAVHVETRYVGPFAILLGIVPVVAIRSRDLHARQALARASAGVAIGLSAALAPGTAYSVLIGLTPVVPHRQASEIRSLGVDRGDLVAVIGDGPTHYWARLADVRIVAELPSWDAHAFWAGNREAQSAGLSAMRRVGARAVVTTDSSAALAGGWVPVDGGGLYIRLLEPEGSS